ncbi:hypothetical protein LTR37_013537 [Vermiconidia calcicola]|uniref:Uncharacterized protein n=1 Tax=Vermiconidia calcicola TaxID=1690605 RepID=A0ACC3MZ48_9PEZI|nr:hypothetical protein LTR37_013537 [Vermiconidia calcicola]
MLPEILFGSYKKYKSDTNVFTTWLSQAAKSCGYKPKAPKLKGRDRKLAREAAAQAGQTPKNVSNANNEPTRTHYSVSTSELLKQAESVAGSTKKPIRLPDEIQRVLERAIAARRRCADWFLKTGVQDKRSETGHSHFIKILQRALDLLGPSAPSQEPTAGQHEENGTAGATEKNPDHHAASLENRFASLDVEDGEDDVTVADITNIATNTPGSKNKTPTTNVYDLELDEHSEATFHVFCYMEDLHRLQHQLLEL